MFGHVHLCKNALPSSFKFAFRLPNRWEGRRNNAAVMNVLLFNNGVFPQTPMLLRFASDQTRFDGITCYEKSVQSGDQAR